EHRMFPSPRLEGATIGEADFCAKSKKNVARTIKSGRRSDKWIPLVGEHVSVSHFNRSWFAVLDGRLGLDAPRRGHGRRVQSAVRRSDYAHIRDAARLCNRELNHNLTTTSFFREVGGSL